MFTWNMDDIVLESCKFLHQKCITIKMQIFGGKF